MARGRQRRDELIRQTYHCPVCLDADPRCPACGGDGIWPGGISPYQAAAGYGGLTGVTEGATGPIGGWGGGHA